MSETRGRGRVEGEGGAPGPVSLGARLYDPRNPTFSRSSKLHRPRGLLCSTGLCPNCMMEVDGIPNVRVCECMADGSPVVKMQNTIPVVDRLGVLSRLHKFIGVGFQYRMMYSGKSRRRLFYSVLKRASGLGVGVSSAVGARPNLEKLTPDVLVAGGGAAGLSAALEASKGREVLLVDSGNEIGGDYLSRFSSSRLDEVRERVASLRTLIEQVRGSKRIRVLPRTRVVGYYGLEGVFLCLSDHATYEVKTRNAIVATGSHEVLPMFTDNDNPRVMLSFSAQAILSSGASIGRRAVVLDVNGDGMLVAADISARGTQVELVSTPGGLTDEAKALGKKYGLESAAKSFAVRASASGLDLAVGPESRRIEADAVVVCGRQQPNYELAAMLGCELELLVGGKQTTFSAPGQGQMNVAVAGVLAGCSSLEACVEDGKKAGAAVRDGQPTNRRVTVQLGPDPYLERAFTTSPEDAYVCLCEDVTLNETTESIKQGYDNVETLKRFTGALTGPCQGKQCALTVAAILARDGLKGTGSNPFTTTRPPIVSVPFSRLATGE